MSWVVPSIAAEVLGVSLDHVMSQIRAGALASREEFGFLWVEVTGQSVSRGARRPRRRRPRTYTRRPIAPIVSSPSSVCDDELRALGDPSPAVAAGAQDGSPDVATEPSNFAPAGIQWLMTDVSPPPELAAVDPPEPDECESPEDPDDGVPMNWREARSRAASTRRKPPGM
jgi:hypothetical protein